MTMDAGEAERLVQRQLDAYNARDIDAFTACWAEDCEYSEFPDRPLLRGVAALRARHMERFREPGLHARLLGRLVLGGLVVDRERVRRHFPDGPGEVEVLAIHEVIDGRIACAWFRQGPPGPVAEDAAAASPGTIRRADAADADAVESLVAQAYARWVRPLGRPPSPMLDDHAALIAAGHVHLLEADGSLLGLAVLVPEDGVTLLHNIAVAPGRQRQGLGRRLLDFTEAEARAAGHRAVRLYTNAAMTGNIELYRRVGYRETGRHSAGGLHRVDMRKALD